jgi:antitoxin (DNA-binding transcriptional repressor) of toxin-antitoxin stability system
VRAAKKQTIIVTDRGEKVATLKPHVEEAAARPVFKGRDWSKLPSSPVDSTAFISEDRDRW